jgi:hypothetical protein
MELTSFQKELTDNRYCDVVALIGDKVNLKGLTLLQIDNGLSQLGDRITADAGSVAKDGDGLRIHGSLIDEDEIVIAGLGGLLDDVSYFDFHFLFSFQ